MTTGLYLLIGFGVVLCAAGWIGLRWERVQVGDEHPDLEHRLRPAILVPNADFIRRATDYEVSGGWNAFHTSEECE